MDIINKLAETNRGLRFDAPSHTYTIGDKRLFSVTRIVGAFKQPFESKKIAKRYGDKVGLTQDQVLRQWEFNRNVKATCGTWLHEQIETSLKNGELTKGIKERCSDAAQEQVQKLIDELSDTNRFLTLSEVKICNKKHRIAGTIDLLVFDKQQGVCHIIDIKSNTEFEGQKAYGVMKRPLHIFKDVRISHAFIQTNLYEFMIREALGHEWRYVRNVLNFPVQVDDWRIKTAQDFQATVDSATFEFNKPFYLPSCQELMKQLLNEFKWKVKTGRGI